MHNVKKGRDMNGSSPTDPQERPNDGHLPVSDEVSSSLPRNDDPLTIDTADIA